MLDNAVSSVGQVVPVVNERVLAFSISGENELRLSEFVGIATSTGDRECSATGACYHRHIR